MRTSHLKLIGCVGALLLLIGCESAQVREFMDKVGTGVTQGQSPLTQKEVAAGLRQALTIGAEQSAKTLHEKDAFLNNPLIRISFPPEAIKVKNTLEKLGLTQLTESFVVSLNRAAENAAIRAKPIFVSAIKAVTLDDALKILRGENDAATRYLEEKTSADLSRAFQPVVAQSLSQVDATKYWGQLMSHYNRIPFVERINPDLPAYVTGRALTALFSEVAEEEKKIREAPMARVTELLKRVFGHPDAKSP